MSSFSLEEDGHVEAAELAGLIQGTVVQIRDEVAAVLRGQAGVEGGGR
jgi:hypothetical protein